MLNEEPVTAKLSDFTKQIGLPPSLDFAANEAGFEEWINEMIRS